MDRGELEKLVITLEEEMYTAAEELRFEYAAKLRDEIKELRRELLALDAGRLSTGTDAVGADPRRAGARRRPGRTVPIWLTIGSRRVADRSRLRVILAVVTPGVASRRGYGARPRVGTRTPVAASTARALAGAARPRPGAGRRRGRPARCRATIAGRDDLELLPLDDRRLVDVAAEDQLGARVGEPREHACCAPRAAASAFRHGAPISWWWSATTRSAPGCAVAKLRRRALELGASDAPALVAPRLHRVEPDDLERRAPRTTARSSPTAARTRDRGA